MMYLIGIYAFGVLAFFTICLAALAIGWDDLVADLRRDPHLAWFLFGPPAVTAGKITMLLLIAALGWPYSLWKLVRE